MRIGIVADIHNDAAALRTVLDELESRQIDQLLTLGDTVDSLVPATGAEDVATLLLERNAIGVWGNHDCFFHHDTPDHLREQFAQVTFDFMQQTKPQHIIDDVLFTHRESSIDPYDFAQLWEIDFPFPDLFDIAQRAFAASEASVQIMGHYHRWWAATPAGPIAWDGSSRLRLDPSERYVVIVGAVYQGSAAVLDLATRCLTPVGVPQGTQRSAGE